MYMEIILTVFQKERGKWAILARTNGASLYLWIHFKDFFEILHKERGQEVSGTYINCFPEKSLRSNRPFCPENGTLS